MGSTGFECVFSLQYSSSFLENLSSVVADFPFSYFEYVGGERSVSERFTVCRALSARSFAALVLDLPSALGDVRIGSVLSALDRIVFVGSTREVDS
jgi:hypothetical protein